VVHFFKVSLQNCSKIAIADAVSEVSEDDSCIMTTTDSSSDVTSACKTLTADNDVVTRRSSKNRLTDIECHLELKELWDKFHKLGTEMIITKSGRCVRMQMYK